VTSILTKGKRLDDNLTVTSQSIDSLEAIYQQKDTNLIWNLVFTIPAWLKIWWQSFGAGAEQFIRSVYQEKQIIGIAPLQIRSRTASIIGNVDVCDYQDFIISPGKESEFFNAILDDLNLKGVTDLHLETVRPDSSAVVHLVPIAISRGYKVDYHPSDVSSDLLLLRNWEEYLSSLDGKQRHELKRKMRNLQNTGENRYYCTSERGEMRSAIEQFLKLFPESRGDKAQFMTAEMQTYFRKLTLSLAEVGVVRFGTLEFERKPVAMVMYFDYNNNVYLYNSAYDPNYRSMSVGIISKAGCIRDNIEKNKQRFDFLKGPEIYKSYLGGKEIQLYSCHISLK
jgi:CelD/BcsL family acetyltransferase involved in cellulose biosynthesis